MEGLPTYQGTPMARPKAFGLQCRRGVSEFPVRQVFVLDLVSNYSLTFVASITSLHGLRETSHPLPLHRNRINCLFFGPGGWLRLDEEAQLIFTAQVSTTISLLLLVRWARLVECLLLVKCHCQCLPREATLRHPILMSRGYFIFSRSTLSSPAPNGRSHREPEIQCGGQNHHYKIFLTAHKCIRLRL